MQLLNMKTKIVMRLPGILQKEGIYCRRYWQRVQHVCNEFWTRWKKEVFATLQSRQKWNCPKQNFQVGDVVLIRDDSMRSK